MRPEPPVEIAVECFGHHEQEEDEPGVEVARAGGDDPVAGEQTKQGHPEDRNEEGDVPGQRPAGTFAGRYAERHRSRGSGGRAKGEFDRCAWGGAM